MDNEEIDYVVVEKFEILVRLGKGAYGIVWKARDRRTGVVVALKKVFGAFNNDVDAQRTYREVFILQELHHPNVVALLNVMKSSNEKDLYMVFEYIETDLYSVITKTSLSGDQITYIIYQIFVGLIYLESVGIMHRDIKPANILIDKYCRIKLADFGLARSVVTGDSQVIPIMTEYVATKVYRAPEVLLGATNYSCAVDIWAVGCVIGELYKKKPIFSWKTIVQQIELIFSIIGKPEKQDLLSNYISPNIEIINKISEGKKVHLPSFLGTSNHLLIDLFLKTLNYNQFNRITAKNAIAHPFFLQSPIYSKLKNIQIIESEYLMENVYKDDIKLSYSEYRNEIYRMITLRKKENRKKALKKMNNHP